MMQQLYKLTYVKNGGGGRSLLTVNDAQERMTKAGLYEYYQT